MSGHKEGNLGISQGYVCDICKAVNMDADTHQRHLRIHAEERPFLCECGKTFKDSHSLKRHEKSHDDQLRPYVCDICFKSFKDPSSCSRHQKIHMDQPRNFHCDKCEKSFTDKHGLRRHRKTHLGLKPFDCNVCGKSFGDSGSYRRHQKIHSGVRNFHCWKCKRSFLEKQSLMRHMKNVCGHNGYDEHIMSFPHLNFKMVEDLSQVESYEETGTIIQNLQYHISKFNDEESDVGSNKCKSKNQKDVDENNTTSLESLINIKTEENFSENITGLVESIDSFEAMMSLHRDPNEQVAEPVVTHHSPPMPDVTHHSPPMPDGLMCFECGEHLVNGKNFTKIGKHLSTISSNSFKCLNCETVDRDFISPQEDCSNGEKQKIMGADIHMSKSHLLESLQSTSSHASVKQWFTCPKCETQFQNIDSFSNHESVCCTVLNEATDCIVSERLDSISSKAIICTQNTENGNNDNMNDGKKMEEEEEEGDTNLTVTFQTDMPDTCNKNVEEIDDIHFQQRPSYNMSYPMYKNNEFDLKLQLHMSNHKRNRKVTCSECGKCFFDSFALKRHIRTHADIRPFICKFCSRGYCDNWSLKKHLSRGCVYEDIKVPASQLYPCPECMRMFSLRNYLKEHMEKSHVGRPLKFECDICSKKFSEAANVKRHCRLLHMFICQVCDREFKDVQSLQHHQTNDCSGTQSQSNLQLPPAEGFPCPECGKLYATKAYLERHKKFHSELKPYKCEVCSKRFTESFGLKRHLKTHSNSNKSGPRTNVAPKVKRKMGDIDIGLKFLNTCGQYRKRMLSKAKKHSTFLHSYISSDNDKQSRTITNEKGNLQNQLHKSKLMSDVDMPKEDTRVHKHAEYKCAICYKVFHKNYMLFRHMNVHSQDRPFSCDFCGKSYKDTSSLRRHQLTHKGTTDFICTLCGKDFLYADSLRRHMRESCKIKKSSNSQSLLQGISVSNKSSDIDLSSNDDLQMVEDKPTSGKLCIKLFKLYSERCDNKKKANRLIKQ